MSIFFRFSISHSQSSSMRHSVASCSHPLEESGNFNSSHFHVSDRVNRVSATETVDSGLVTGRFKSGYKNWYLQLPCLTFSDKKEQCEASTECGRHVGKRQLDSKTEMSLCCLLAKEPWRIICK